MEYRVTAERIGSQFDGRGKLVRLNPNQADNGPTVGAVDQSDDPIGPDAPVGLVVGVDANCHIGAQNLASTGVFSETVQADTRV
jgi:hypothetical protein